MFTTDFEQLGLSDELIKALQNMNIESATEIQSLVIPAIMSGSNVLFASQTGTGKTLAYLLPVIQSLKEEEKQQLHPPTSAPSLEPSSTSSLLKSSSVPLDPSRSGMVKQELKKHSSSPSLSEDAVLFGKFITRPKRPRAIVLVPNRELACQVLNVVKEIGHFAKIRSAVITGGQKSKQIITSLKGHIDLLVATPGRLIKMFEKRHIYFSDCRFVIIDEVDTMFDPKNKFLDDIKKVVAPLRNRSTMELSTNITSNIQRDVKFILSTASLRNSLAILLKNNFENLKIVEASHLHQLMKNLEQHFVHVGVDDKLMVLANVLSSNYLSSPTSPSASSLKPHKKSRSSSALIEATKPSSPSEFPSSLQIPPTIVFCNTIPSCRAVEHFLREKGFSSTTYHGEIPPEQRDENFENFLKGNRSVLVATDMASRGLDTRFVKHIIQFDFPLNPIDYLHRVGRTARAGGSGKVTNLICKRDKVLAEAIKRAHIEDKPIHLLSSNKSHPSSERIRPRMITKRRGIHDKKRGIPRTTLPKKWNAKKRYTSPYNRSPKLSHSSL